MTALLAIAPALVAFWGWASLALGVSSRGPIAVLSLVGFAGSVLARRAPGTAAVLELGAGVVLVALGIASDRLSFSVLGALLVVSARAISEAARRAGD